ncbi:hypothetical protein JHK86_055742 [Glycine max]|nr:hypothetical protein JHK86_055742 [Glycine max]
MPFHYPKVLENGQQPRFRSQHQGFWSARDRNGTTIMATSTFVRNFPQNHETRQNRNRGRYLKPCNLAVPLKTHNNNLQTKVLFSMYEVMHGTITTGAFDRDEPRGYGSVIPTSASPFAEVALEAPAVVTIWC